MSVASATPVNRPWRAAALSSVFGLLLSVIVFGAVGGYWLLDWTYGEETMIGVAANAMLIIPRLFLMSVASVFGAAAVFRAAPVRARNIAIAAAVIAAVMCAAILNWRRLLSPWYTEAFLGVSAVEAAAGLVAGVGAGLAGGVVAKLQTKPPVPPTATTRRLQKKTAP